MSRIGLATGQSCARVRHAMPSSSAPGSPFFMESLLAIIGSWVVGRGAAGPCAVPEMVARNEIDAFPVEAGRKPQKDRQGNAGIGNAALHEMRQFHLQAFTGRCTAARMVLIMQLLEPLACHMGVDGGG